MLSRLILMLVIGVAALGLIACGEQDTQGGEGLKFSVNGEVAPGQDVELRVIFEDTDIGVQNAVLTLNGKVAGRTDNDGRITISIPPDAINVNIVASSSGHKGELGIEFHENGQGTLVADGTNTFDGNFRFLVSDDVNAIEDFQSLDVVISSIGILEGGESGKWREIAPLVGEVDLTQLQGANAQEIWSGDLDPGVYGKVFIYVEQVTGVLKETGEQVEVKLPSNKLHINLPFKVTESSTTSYVYDLTVVAAGNGQNEPVKYILKPQIGQSGTHQKFSKINGLEGEEDGLVLNLEGEAEPGEEVDLLVTSADTGTPVENALVTLNGEEVGFTDADGRITLAMPLDDHEVEIVATSEDLSGKLEIEFPQGEEYEGYEEDDEEYEGELTLVLESEAEPGEEVDLLVTSADTGTPVENALVTLNEEEVGFTDADGRITLAMPLDDHEVKVVATSEDLSGKLEIEFPHSEES